MTTQTLTLTEFLLARIAEDEKRAPRYHDGMCESMMRGDRDPSAPCDCGLEDERRFLVRDYESKRRIVGMASNVLESWEANHGREGRSMWPDVNRRERHHANETLYALAAPYADHPDYREEWRP